MKRILTAVFAVLQTAIVAHAASVCANPQELKFLQATALRQQLAVSVRACGYDNDYFHFMAVYGDALAKSDAAAKQFFQNHKGAETLESYRLRLAQDALIGSTQDPHFCQSTKAVFDLAFKRAAMDPAHPPPVIPTGYETCRPLAPPTPKIAAILPSKPIETPMARKTPRLSAKGPLPFPHILKGTALTLSRVPRAARVAMLKQPEPAPRGRHAVVPRVEMLERVRTARLTPPPKPTPSGRLAATGARAPLPVPRPERDANAPPASAPVVQREGARRLAAISPRKPKLAQSEQWSVPVNAVRTKRMAPAPHQAEMRKSSEADATEFDRLITALAATSPPKTRETTPIMGANKQSEKARPVVERNVVERPAADDGERSGSQAGDATDDVDRLDDERDRRADERDRYASAPRRRAPRRWPWPDYAYRRPPPWAYDDRRSERMYDPLPAQPWYPRSPQFDPDD